MKNPAKHYLLSLKRAIGKMAKSPELFVKRPGKDFTRKRKLDFRKTVSFLLTSVGKSLSNELLQFFSCKSSFPTVSAFIQQRDKLSKTAFVELFHSFSKSNIPNQTFKGYRLLAVDGSSLCTPPNPADKDSYFPSVNGKKHFNLLHINALYDLCSHTYGEQDQNRYRRSTVGFRQLRHQGMVRSRALMPPGLLSDCARNIPQLREMFFAFMPWEGISVFLFLLK